MGLKTLHEKKAMHNLIERKQRMLTTFVCAWMVVALTSAPPVTPERYAVEVAGVMMAWMQNESEFLDSGIDACKRRVGD